MSEKDKVRRIESKLTVDRYNFLAETIETLDSYRGTEYCSSARLIGIVLGTPKTIEDSMIANRNEFLLETKRENSGLLDKMHEAYLEKIRTMSPNRITTEMQYRFSQKVWHRR